MSEPTNRVLLARTIVPVDAPIIRDGAIAMDGGRIVAVGSRRDVSLSDASVEDLGDVALFPGLINAHTHLELSHATPGPRPASFGEWLLGVVTRRSAAMAGSFEETVAAATRDGAAESLRFGVTCVGDISREAPITRRVLRDGPLRVVSFGEVQAMATRRSLLDERLAAAIDDRLASDRLSIGVSPHAPYTVEPGGYRACVSAAELRGLPICTHLAESPDEARFLNEHAGPLRELWERLGAWDDRVPRFAGSPIALAESVGLLNVAPLLAHVNYASDAEIARLARAGVSVVWCPRTHAFFGHPPHRWREMLAAGVNVCLGTDSRASSPDLNALDDARLAWRGSPDVDPRVIWSMVTTRAARALKREDLGELAAGRRADVVAFATTSDDPMWAILEGDALPTGVWIDGESIC